MKNNLKKSFKSLRGFTLIEMLVVVAIISILAGIVLTGVTGFQANARDTKRIADLKQIQNYLELYYNRFGHYPGGAGAPPSGAPNGAVSDWEALRDSLAGLGVTLPNDPLSNRSYFYATDSADNAHYILGAKLERDNNALRRPEDLDSGDVDAKATLYGFGSWSFSSGVDSSSCNDDSPTFGYCIE